MKRVALYAASDFMTCWRPAPCELRVFLRERAKPKRNPSHSTKSCGGFLP